MPETHKDKPLPGKTNSEVDITDQKTHQAHIAEQNQIKSIGGRQEVKIALNKRFKLYKQLPQNPEYCWELKKMQKKYQLGG